MVTIRSSSSDVISPALYPGLVPSIVIEFPCQTMRIPLIQVNIGLLADKIRVATADTLDSGQSVHDFLFAVDIGIKETKDELDYLSCQRRSCRLGYDVSYSSISPLRQET